MDFAALVLTALFALTAVAFIGVLNSRGVGRTVIAALLALFCLGAALWQTTAYRAAKVAGVSLLPGVGAAVGAFGSVVTSGSPGAQGGVGSADFAEGRALEAAERPDDVGELVQLVMRAGALRDSMNAEDPAGARALSDSEYQAFERRAESYLTNARGLRERAARLAATPVAGTDPRSVKQEEVAELLSGALHALTASARDLRAFFRAAGRDEEQRLTASFRRGLDASDASLRRAQAGAGALSTSGQFERGQP
jgi:hypothetical protein